MGEINFSWLGMVLCFASNVFRAIRGGLQQKLLVGESRDRFDPCSLLFWCSFPSVAVTFAGSLVFEGIEPYRRVAGIGRDASLGLCLAISISCVNAAALNLANLFVTRHLGAVGAQMLAQTRAMLVVLADMALFGEPVTPLEIFGFVVVLSSVALFAAIEEGTKGREQPKDGSAEATRPSG